MSEQGGRPMTTTGIILAAGKGTPVDAADPSRSLRDQDAGMALLEGPKEPLLRDDGDPVAESLPLRPGNRHSDEQQYPPYRPHTDSGKP